MQILSQCFGKIYLLMDILLMCTNAVVIFPHRDVTITTEMVVFQNRCNFAYFSVVCVSK